MQSTLARSHHYFYGDKMKQVKHGYTNLMTFDIRRMHDSGVFVRKKFL